MSYILDALRRADAERQRGAVPGLHAQPVAAALGAGGGARAPLLPWLVAGVMLALLLLALLAWRYGPASRDDGAGAQPAAAAAPAASMPTTVLAAAPTAIAQPAAPLPVPPTPAPPAIAPAAPAAPQLAPPPAPATAALQAAGSTTVTVTVTGPGVAAAPTRVAVGAAPAIAAARGASSAPGAAAAASPVSPAPAAEPPLTAATVVPPLVSLPDALRRQLPPLALAGGMYADTPAQRLVLVNGQVSHEGDDLGNGLRLLQIRPRSAVFGFRDQRFELAY